MTQVAKNYVKLAVHLDANEGDGDDGLTLGFARKVCKLSKIAPECQIRHGGSFSWVFPFIGDGSGGLSTELLQSVYDVKVAIESAVNDQIRESVWRSKDAEGLDVIGKCYDT